MYAKTALARSSASGPLRKGCRDRRLAVAQLTFILRGFAFSDLGSTSVMTPSTSSALIASCSILLESRKLRA